MLLIYGKLSHLSVCFMVTSDLSVISARAVKPFSASHPNTGKREEGGREGGMQRQLIILRPASRLSVVRLVTVETGCQ